jgi:hypothetical protein
VPFRRLLHLEDAQLALHYVTPNPLVVRANLAKVSQGYGDFWTAKNAEFTAR